MSVEDAIKRLEKLKAIYSGMDIKSDIEALDMAISALQFKAECDNALDKAYGKMIQREIWVEKT